MNRKVPKEMPSDRKGHTVLIILNFIFTSIEKHFILQKNALKIEIF